MRNILALILMIYCNSASCQIVYDSILNKQFDYYDTTLVRFHRIKVTTMFGTDTFHLLPIDEKIYQNGFLQYDKIGYDITKEDSIEKNLNFSYYKDNSIQYINIKYYPIMFQTKNGEVLKYDEQGNYQGYKFGNYGSEWVDVILKPQKEAIGLHFYIYYYRYYNKDNKLLTIDTVKIPRGDAILRCDTEYNRGFLVVSKHYAGSFRKEYYTRDSLRFREQIDTNEDGSINKFIDTVRYFEEPSCCYINRFDEYNTLGKLISGEDWEYEHGFLDTRTGVYIEDYLSSYSKYWIVKDNEEVAEDKYHYDENGRLYEHEYFDDMSGFGKVHDYLYKDGLLKYEKINTFTKRKITNTICYYYRYEFLE